MAGAGYKLFATGDVLTAAQVNTYLQEQAVMVFASAAARTTALSGVLAEGMITYLKDTDAVEKYNGTSWVSVGGSSPLTTKGDLYTYSTTDARLPVGTNGQYLKADSTAATGLSWATLPSSGKVLQVVQVTTTTTVTSSTNTQVSTGMTASITPSATSSKILVLASTTFQKSSSNAANRIQVQVKRGATQIALSENVTYNNTAVETVSPWALTYLDSPSTTSSTTYDITFANAANVASVSAQYSSSTGSIILLEIGA